MVIEVDVDTGVLGKLEAVVARLSTVLAAAAGFTAAGPDEGAGAGGCAAVGDTPDPIVERSKVQVL